MRPSVHWLLALLLAPGSVLSGIAVPGVAQLESIRAPASENAATWLHLLAASVLAIVVIPRLLLAVGTGIVERHRAARVAVPLGEPYYQRLLRGFRGGPVRVRVIPYSYAVPPAALAGLEAIVARAFGGSAALTVEPPVAYGDEDALAETGADRWPGSRHRAVQSHRDAGARRARRLRQGGGGSRSRAAAARPRRRVRVSRALAGR